MEKQPISRREFLRLGILAGAGALVSACGLDRMTPNMIDGSENQDGSGAKDFTPTPEPEVPQDASEKVFIEMESPLRVDGVDPFTLPKDSVLYETIVDPINSRNLGIAGEITGIFGFNLFTDGNQVGPILYAMSEDGGKTHVKEIYGRNPNDLLVGSGPINFTNKALYSRDASVAFLIDEGKYSGFVLNSVHAPESVLPVIEFRSNVGAYWVLNIDTASNPNGIALSDTQIAAAGPFFDQLGPTESELRNIHLMATGPEGSREVGTLNLSSLTSESDVKGMFLNYQEGMGGSEYVDNLMVDAGVWLSLQGHTGLPKAIARTNEHGVVTAWELIAENENGEFLGHLQKNGNEWNLFGVEGVEKLDPSTRFVPGFGENGEQVFLEMVNVEDEEKALRVIDPATKEQVVLFELGLTEAKIAELAALLTCSPCIEDRPRAPGESNITVVSTGGLEARPLYDDKGGSIGEVVVLDVVSKDGDGNAYVAEVVVQIELNSAPGITQLKGFRTGVLMNNGVGYQEAKSSNKTMSVEEWKTLFSERVVWRFSLENDGVDIYDSFFNFLRGSEFMTDFYISEVRKFTKSGGSYVPKVPLIMTGVPIN